MEFYQCLERLRVPDGSRLVTGKSSDLARQLNVAIEKAIGEWCWFVGDDHTFEPDIVLRLLEHRLPAVVPVNIQRVPPFGPVILKGPSAPKSEIISWAEVPAGGGLWALPQDHYVGSAGLLVQRATLERIEPPYFRIGQYAPDRLNEDYWIFDQLKALGVPVVVDLGARMGHINSFAAMPTVKDGKWWVVFAQDGKLAFAAEGQ
jgi:hypothetical protein